MRDAVLLGPTTGEIVALARLARDAEALPPPHLCRSLRSKGWIVTPPDGSMLITVAGRILADQADGIDLEQLASIPSKWASWRDGTAT